jgi:ribosomal protein S12 methylthiotransferase
LSRAGDIHPLKATCSIISLGCPKNLVDGERMLGLLRAEGYQLVREPEGADFVIVNTCGFLKAAREESLAAIAEMTQLKQKGVIRGVIVAGCLAQRDREQLLAQCPGIDQLVGLSGREQIGWAAAQVMAGQGHRGAILPAGTGLPLCDGNRVRITPRHLAYLKVSEGCSQLCTFCTIPKIKGEHVSKPIEQVVAEAEELAADGVRELVVVAQDTTSYGVDLAQDGGRTGQPLLARLLERLDQIEPLAWIRLMYLNPHHFTDELLGVLASAHRILPYLDLPLQHVSDKILRRMNRRMTRVQIEQLLDTLRGSLPGLVLRTTMMTGFPGETDRQFQELLQFVLARRFERLGVFAYSREPGTAAAQLPDQVAPEKALARRDRLLAAQQEIAFAWGQSQVGRRLDVLIDRCVPGEENAFVGRSYADAPEIDGAVYVTGEALAPGEIIPCEVVAARGYDLVAAALGPGRRQVGRA